MTQLFFTCSVSVVKQISAVSFMTQSDKMSTKQYQNCSGNCQDFQLQLLNSNFQTFSQQIVLEEPFFSNWVEFAFIINENLRVFAAVKVFRVKKLTKMRLLSWTIDLKTGPLPHVETSLIGFSLKFLVSSHYL